MTTRRVSLAVAVALAVALAAGLVWVYRTADEAERQRRHEWCVALAAGDDYWTSGNSSDGYLCTVRAAAGPVQVRIP